MAENFIDYVKIYMRSGKGGSGSAHFHRAKGNPKGGPDGGNGGRGGHIILKGNNNLWTLLHLKYRKHVFAENGKSGEENQRTGADGKDEILEVPLGTIAKDAETGEILCEITQDEQKHVLLPGGRGGLGNVNFKSSTNRAPQYAQPGEQGIESAVVLELKVLADVGLVGFPNAGKSTLLSVISAAKPEIADYPFTTITPNLGVVKYYDYQSFVVADIPGIIEGASEGKGLGHRFLRHIERNAVLLFLIPANSENIQQEYKVLVNELKKFNPEMLLKQRVIAISKCELLEEQELKKLKTKLKKLNPIFISSLAGINIQELKDLLWRAINQSYDNQ
ncbi:MAG: GTPase ObgE [Bacteroidia bacterium]|nr:GTPase ObgE [Bacteroidia bacterium]MCO5253006.1 GTPase ObgE [Bacteroidota bacterium]